MAKTKKNGPVYLSKTLFLKGLQCHKALYLFKFHPELRDELSESKEAIFQSGTQLGILAQGLFPGGREIPYEGLLKNSQLQLTEEKIAEGIRTLYEATFRYNDIFVKSDIINKGRKGWDLYEVKGSAGLKDIYLEDIALQYYVLKKSGLPVNNAFIVYVNNQYVRKGELDLAQLFTKEKVTSQVLEKQASIQKEIKKLKKMLVGDMPSIDIGEHCGDPYPCDFQGYCWDHVPEYSVLDLSGRAAARWELYRQGYLSVEGVPLDRITEKNKMEIEAVLNQKEILNRKGIKDFLDTLWYPLYFLDFETINPAIPLYDGTRPFQKIPFQYSLHYLKSPQAKLEQYEFLAPPNTDPRKPLLEKLLSQIPPEACVLAYNATFEIGVLNQLAEWFPRYRENLPEPERLELVSDAGQRGAVGVDLGRNLFQSENPRAMIQAFRAVVHENAAPGQALELFYPLKHSG